MESKWYKKPWLMQEREGAVGSSGKDTNNIGKSKKTNVATGNSIEWKSGWARGLSGSWRKSVEWALYNYMTFGLRSRILRLALDRHSLESGSGT
jgi:hypothetical protein